MRKVLLFLMFVSLFLRCQEDKVDSFHEFEAFYPLNDNFVVKIKAFPSTANKKQYLAGNFKAMKWYSIGFPQVKRNSSSQVKLKIKNEKVFILLTLLDEKAKKSLIKMANFHYKSTGASFDKNNFKALPIKLFSASIAFTHKDEQETFYARGKIKGNKVLLCFKLNNVSEVNLPKKIQQGVLLKYEYLIKETKISRCRYIKSGFIYTNIAKLKQDYKANKSNNLLKKKCVKCKQNNVFCSTCRGQGEIVCKKCKGNGTIKIKINPWKAYKYSLGGKLRICPICNGSGEIACLKCQRKGLICSHCQDK